MKHFTRRSRVREVFRSAGLSLGIALATLAALEIFLRVADFRELREGLSERSLSYAYDAELGWAPVPNSSSLITTFRTTHFKHNSLGLVTTTVGLDAKPTIMFLGNCSFWGLDLRSRRALRRGIEGKDPRLQDPGGGRCGVRHRQEYLLLKRLWPKVKPRCRRADLARKTTGWIQRRCPLRQLSETLLRHPTGRIGGPDGTASPEISTAIRRGRFVVRNHRLTQLATNIYVRLRCPPLSVPDPTEKLIGNIREFVEGNGAKFLVGIQHHDEALVRYLEANRIPFAKLYGAASLHEWVRPSLDARGP